MLNQFFSDSGDSSDPSNYMKPGLKNNGENEGGLAQQMLLVQLSIPAVNFSVIFKKRSNALHRSVITSSYFLFIDGIKSELFLVRNFAKKSAGVSYTLLLFLFVLITTISACALFMGLILFENKLIGGGKIYFSDQMLYKICL